MKDPVVLQYLQSTGFDVQKNFDQFLIYESIEKKPRILDKEPKRLSLTKLVDVQIFGCCQEFVELYNSQLAENTSPTARIDMQGVAKECDVPVYYVLVTLIHEAVTANESKGLACLELFRLIITAPVEQYDVQSIRKLLDGYRPQSYWEGELYRAIYKCLFDENDLVMYWKSLCEYESMYPAAFAKGRDLILQNCEKTSDIEAFLRPYVKACRDDREFCKPYGRQVSKWLLAIMYHFKDTNPEVLDPGNIVNSGFAK